jgi:hypothetical protein
VEQALDGPLHEAFSIHRFGAPLRHTWFMVEGSAFEEGKRLRAALNPCFEKQPHYPEFLFQLDLKGEVDTASVEGKPATQARIRKALSGLLFPCLANFYVDAQQHDVF